MSGVGGAGAATLGFPAWVWLDGQEYPCQLQADFAGRERILGRDVLNSLDILFRGPAGEVIVNQLRRLTSLPISSERSASSGASDLLPMLTQTGPMAVDLLC